ncbi:MAG: sigma-70 family RNA polymerase sigma factor [Treponema sp.]|jgi:RNA polymerase sigma-70 factor (ECF subfamily)|nr:sigma-70 family RNA polymerase sigma factor [Treponema sp.]
MMAQIDGEKIRQNALKDGDSAKEAFSELWHYFYPRLMRFAVSFRGLPIAEYDDHVSDILIKGFQNIERYNPDYALSTWVYKIAENHFNDVLRKTKKSSSVLIDDLGMNDFSKIDSSSIIEDETADRDLLERCKNAINLLKDDDRKIAFLKFYESMSSAEIGRILGISPGTVRWRISLIRAFIEKHTGGMSNED